MVKKKNYSVMLQGYLYEANFGDILFAHLFYRKCQDLKFDNVDFIQWQRVGYRNLGIGKFCRKELKYSRQKSFLSCLKADAIVLISGGSLWDDSSKKEATKARYLRFILPMRLYQLMHKPVYILGVGGGPVDTLWLRRRIIKTLNRAKLVYFRDEKTLDVFRDYGVKNKMVVTADTALTITADMLNPLEEKSVLENFAGGKRKLLLHIPDGHLECKTIVDIILPGLILFLKQHEEFSIVLSNDNLRNMSESERKEIERIKHSLESDNIDYYFYKYHDSWQMCSLIDEMDCVITLKLHVGVVGCALDKCVIPFPVHREKTDNFYQMIGESERCINVRNLNTNKVYEQINKYYDKPVHISDELRKRAEMNLSAIDNIIK